jgi:capsular exopolysaccharide synthesis family protein
LRTLLVTSAIPAEGKSTIVANLAATVGKSGRSVLVIDADLLLPTLHKIFEVPNEIGLSHVLAGELNLNEAIQETKAPGVWLLTSGIKTINRAELLESPSMRSVLEEAERQFDVVIIDSPALLAVTDGVILASAVDGVVMVVRRAQTHEAALKAALQLLKAANPKLIGVVVNRVKQNANYQYYRYYHRTIDQNKN